VSDVAHGPLVIINFFLIHILCCALSLLSLTVFCFVQWFGGPDFTYPGVFTDCFVLCSGLEDQILQIMVFLLTVFYFLQWFRGSDFTFYGVFTDCVLFSAVVWRIRCWVLSWLRRDRTWRRPKTS
jgi:hypothetical protein